MAKMYVGNLENQEKIISDLSSKGSLYNQNEIISKQNSMDAKIDRQGTDISKLLKNTGAVKSIQQGHQWGINSPITIEHSSVNASKSIIIFSNTRSSCYIDSRSSNKFVVEYSDRFNWQLIEFY